MKKVIVILLTAFILLGGIYFIASGFTVRNDVYLNNFTLSHDRRQMTLSVGVSGSAGYIRSAENVSDEKEYIDLKFYSAFGGINGTVGKRDSFNVELSEESKEIRIFTDKGFETVVYKNEITGDWEIKR